MTSKERPTLRNCPSLRLSFVDERDGLTLLELLIAFVVLQIALVTFAQFMTKALDYSREVRRMEMAQILAQAKMEELFRTLFSDTSPALPPGEAGAPRVLNERPGSFDDFAYAQSEDITPFRWVAEVKPSADNPVLLNLSLHVYITEKRIKSEKVSVPVEDFYISEDRERFSFTHTLSDGSVEVIHGKEKVRVSSAIALP